MNSRQRLLVAAVAAGLAWPAWGQAYPARPVRMIVPFSPGGAADVPGRYVLQKLSEAWGQQVIVDNRPGAGGTIGAELVARAPADGYTLLMISNTHVISAALYKKLNFDAINDFAPVLQFGDAPNILVVHPSLPAKNVKELVALAKSRPGQIDYASSGNGSSQHLFAALFTSMAGINMNHIPYKGSAQATTDLISGQVTVSFPGIAGMLPHIKSGRLRPLAVTSAKRAPELPEIPTIAEAGVKGYEASLWLGVLAPLKTPPEVIARWNAEMSKILNDAAMKNALRERGTETVYRKPEDFGKYLRVEAQKWAKVVKETGAQVN